MSHRGQSVSGCRSERLLRAPLTITELHFGGKLAPHGGASVSLLESAAVRHSSEAWELVSCRGQSNRRRGIGGVREVTGGLQERGRFRAERRALRAGECVDSPIVLSEQLLPPGDSIAASLSLSVASGAALPSARSSFRRPTKRCTSVCPVPSGGAPSVLEAISGRNLKGFELGGGDHLTSIAIAVKRVGLKSAARHSANKQKFTKDASKASPGECMHCFSPSFRETRKNSLG